MTEPDTRKAPPDYESLRSAIIERRDTMPKRLAQAAVYAIENPDEVAFGTAASLAKQACVQPSTLVRLAHYFGFEGFSHLQQTFRQRLRSRYLSYEERLASIEAVAGSTPDAALFDGFLDVAKSSLELLDNSVNRADFSDATAILGQAESIYLIATRRSYPLTARLSYSFSKLGIRHQIVATPNGINKEIVDFATKRDAAVSISYSPYAADTVEHTRSLYKRGIPVVAITDSAFSPIASLSAICMEAPEADFGGFRTLVAPMILTIALAVAVAEYRRKSGRSVS